jgi:hypothetical protein
MAKLKSASPRHDEASLQDPGTWDFASAHRHPPAKRGRAVVSVAFPREDFELVAGQAERERKKLSEFIREAAVARAKGMAYGGELPPPTVSGSVSFGTLYAVWSRSYTAGPSVPSLEPAAGR